MTAAWTRKEGKRASGGLNQKGVESYRRENPGSKLKTAVTRDPSKLKKGGKAAARRKSFCARMSGMKRRNTSSKTANDPNSRINKSLRKWNCESLVDIFEFSRQLRLNLWKDTRSVLEKQGARRDKFINYAKKKHGLRGEAAKREGERLYHAWRRKHGVKHESGRFGNYVDQWTTGESA